MRILGKKSPMSLFAMAEKRPPEIIRSSESCFYRWMSEIGENDDTEVELRLEFTRYFKAQE